MLPLIRHSAAILASPQQGFDPLRTLSQILCVQSLHYMTLALLVPPLLKIFPGTSQGALSFEGGAFQIGLLIDWRELAGRPTWDWDPVDRPAVSWSTERKHVQELYANASKEDKAAIGIWQVGSIWLDDDEHRHSSTDAVNNTEVKLPLVLRPGQIVRPGPTQSKRDPSEAGVVKRAPIETSQQVQVQSHEKEANLERWEWERTRDSQRGWALALGWMLSIVANIQFFVHLVRRPTHILDHVLTLHLLHLLISAWYASSLPTSLFWWTLMSIHAATTSIIAERICIKRELSGGLGGGGGGGGGSAEEEGLIPTERTADILRDPDTSRPTTHVLFDEDEDADGKHANGHGGNAEAYEMKVRADKGSHAD